MHRMLSVAALAALIAAGAAMAPAQAAPAQPGYTAVMFKQAGMVDHVGWRWRWAGPHRYWWRRWHWRRW